MPAGRQIDARQNHGILRVRHVDDGGARGLAHVTYVKRLAVNPDLSAAGTIDMRDAPRVF
jgi:hypothetical protein